MSNEIINPYQTFYDDSGGPLANGTISFLVNLDTALDTIFSDEALTVAQANPYTLDASGRIIGDVKYTGLRTLLIKTDLGATVRTIDNVTTSIDSITVSTQELTTATMAAHTNKKYKSGDVVETAEYSTGKKGGATYDVVLTATVTTNIFDILIGTGSVKNALVSFVLRKEANKVFVNQWGAVLDDSANDLPACQAATDYIIAQGGGDVVIDGSALLTGVSSDDSQLNGLLVPFASFAQDKNVRFIGGLLGGRLRANSNNMILVRASNVGTVCKDLGFEGAGKTSVWAMGAVGENRDQTTTQISQSFCDMLDCRIENCAEGFVMEPGPTVGGSDSGAFYPTLRGNYFNLTTRQIWLKGASAAAIAVGGADGTSAAANRVTRANVYGNKLLRGNVGIDMEYSTEGYFSGNFFEFFDVARGGTSPHTTPAAYFLGVKSENNFIFGGHEEACDFGLDNQAVSFNNVIFGFTLSGVNNNIGVMPKFIGETVQVAEDIEGVTSAVQVVFKNDTFAKITADSSAAATKDLVVSTNGVDRFKWFNGITTHIGSAGNMIFNSVGTGIECDGSAFSLTASGGFFRMTAASDGLYLRVASTDIVKVDATSFRPITDDVTDLGTASFRWEEVFAGIGSINTSDARVKTEVRPFTSDELNAAKDLSKEIGFYQFLKSVDEKGDDAREHVGMTVQRAIEIMESHNLDPFNYGFICYDEWEETLEVTQSLDEEGNVIHEAITGREAGSLFSFRPDQLDRFMIKGLEQRLTDAGI